MSQQTNSMDYGPRDVVGYAGQPPNAQWPNGAKIAIQIVLNNEEGSESTPANPESDSHTVHIASELGPGRKPFEGRDVNQESLYEYGSRAGVWRLLRLFREYGAPCTVFANGQALEMNAPAAQALVEGGHEICSHGYRWVDRSAWSEVEEAEYVKKAIEAIQRTTGKTPRGWYYGMVDSKAAERSRSIVAKVYKDMGLDLKYWADDYSDDLPHYVPYPGGKADEGLLCVPYALDTNDYKNSGYQAFISPQDFSSYLIAAFDELYREGSDGSPKMMSIGLHPRIVGRPARTHALRQFLEYASKKDGVWFATREQIADHWRKVHPYSKQ